MALIPADKIGQNVCGSIFAFNFELLYYQKRHILRMGLAM